MTAVSQRVPRRSACATMRDIAAPLFTSQYLKPDIEWVESGKGMPVSGNWHGRESVVRDVWTSGRLDVWVSFVQHRAVQVSWAWRPSGS